MFKALVVDDEKLARDRIARFLRKDERPFEIEMARDGIEAVKKIRAAAPDLLFLDIQMPGLNGLEVLGQLEHRPFRVIFQTAYDEFAIRAFDENACDYLLKPFSEERFSKALDRALHSLSTEETLRGLERQTGLLNKLTVKQGNQLRVIPVEDILCFVSRDHYTCAHTETSEFIVDLSLGHLEERLDPKQFKRSHRHSLVRTDAVIRVSLGNSMTVQLSNGMQLPISRRQRADWKETLAR